jgi:hypothetical protein
MDAKHWKKFYIHTVPYLIIVKIFLKILWSCFFVEVLTGRADPVQLPLMANKRWGNHRGIDLTRNLSCFPTKRGEGGAPPALSQRLTHLGGQPLTLATVETIIQESSHVSQDVYFKTTVQLRILLMCQLSISRTGLHWSMRIFSCCKMNFSISVAF